jgi:hypothetical protein
MSMVSRRRRVAERHRILIIPVSIWSCIFPLSGGGAHCGAVRANAGRKGRAETLSMRESGLRALVIDAIMCVRGFETAEKREARRMRFVGVTWM